jgi:hypothetical protein
LKNSSYSACAALNVNRNDRPSFAVARQTLHKMGPLAWVREPSSCGKNAVDRFQVAYCIVLNHNARGFAFGF